MAENKSGTSKSGNSGSFNIRKGGQTPAPNRIQPTQMRPGTTPSAPKK